MTLQVYQHDDARQRFERTLANGRLASTYLFTGPDGIGKRSFARLLTASLLCHNTPENELAHCGECESCRLLAAGNHPDVHEVAKPADKSVLPIDLFIGAKEKRHHEGLCHEIALKPYLGKRRVAIIDDADLLHTESANCLLKTLEEPPPHSLLVLIGTSVSKQLPTIRSRCQIVRFSPLDNDTVARILREQDLLEEGEDAEALAAESGGSVGQALASRDAAARQFQATLLTQLATSSFEPARLAADAVAFSAEGGADGSLKRTRLGGLIAAAVGFYRDAMVTGGGGTLSPETAIRCLNHCLTAEAALARNANQATLLQTWLTNLWRVSRGQ